MDVFLISRVPSERVEHFVESLRESGNRYIGPEYQPSVRSVLTAGDWTTIVVYGRNRNNPLPEGIFTARDLVVVYSGYVVDPIDEDTRWGAYFDSVHRDQRPMRVSPGGIYSYATVRTSDGQVCAGHSTPTLEPVYFTQCDDGFHLGNHPLFVHQAGNEFGTPRISETFLLRAAGAGVAIDDHTPFVGTRRLAPGAIVSSRRHLLHVHPAPQPSFGRYRVETLARRVDAVSEGLLEAGSILSRLPKGEFRVSGGKDSRMIAALLKSARLGSIPINQNFPQEVEGQVADMVSAVLNEECRRIPIEEYVDRDLGRATTRKVAYSGGLPAVASQGYPTKAEGSVSGLPLIMGHAHLQRGGFASTRVRTYPEIVAMVKSRSVNPFLRAGFREHNDRLADEWIDSQLRDGKRGPQVLSYTAYLQYTLNYQFQSLYAYVRNWNAMITPMVDERFALLCQQIAESGDSRGGANGIGDLRAERIAMGVIDKLAPELLEFPLANDRFRADVPDTPGYEARDPSLLSPRPVPESDLKRILNTRRLNRELRGQIWDIVSGGLVARLGEEAYLPEVWQFISNPNSEPPAQFNHVLLSTFAMSVLGYSIIQDTPWWETLEVT